MKRSASPETTENFSYLLRLIACVLSDTEPPKPTATTDWASVFYMAKSHSVAGLLYYAVSRLGDEDKPPREISDELLEISRSELVFDTNRDAETEGLLSDFASHGIYCAAVKGYHIKRCYPSSCMRTMSDIDLIVKSSQHNEVKRVFENRGYSLTFDRLSEMDFTREPFHHYEVHYSLSSEVDVGDYYDAVWSKFRYDDNEYIGHFGIEDEYIHALLHLAGHLRFGGAGLRMIMDLYVYRRYYRDRLDVDYIASEVERLGLQSFREVIESLADNWFSGDRPDTDSPIAEYILYSSTFGSREVAIILGSIKSEEQSGKKHSVLYRFFHKLFISYDFLCDRYPLLVGKKALYPVYLIRYWCRRVFIDKNLSLGSAGYYVRGTDSDEAVWIKQVIEELGLDKVG